MASLAELLVAKTAKEYELITRNPSDKLRVKADDKSAAKLLKLAKNHHDACHSLDEAFRSEFTSELIVDGFDDEQLWQQLELQNEAGSRKLLEAFATNSVEEAVFRFVASKESDTGTERKQKLNRSSTERNGKRKNVEDEDNDSDNIVGAGGEHDSDLDSEASNESDDELAAIKKRIKNRDDDDMDLFGGKSLGDSDDDTLFKVEKEDEDEEEEEDENDFDFEIPEKENKSAKQKKQPGKAAAKRKTEVDDKFFKMSEMEEFLEREDRKEELKHKQPGKGEESRQEESSGESEEESEEIDMYGDMSEEDEDKEMMYADFFDPPADGEDMPQDSTKTLDSDDEADEEEAHDDDDDDEEEDEKMDSGDDATEDGKKTVRFSATTKEASNEKVEETLSNFQKRNERLLRQIQSLEEASLQPKGWQMSGEVAAKARPENSLLEEHVEFEQTAPAASEITEEVTQSIEELIHQRIKDKAFDDNQRQVRPREEAFELKTHKTLDQEKSKLALHEVYEQEYLKLQAPEEEETNPQHEEIKKMMAFLFPRLDALASWHYKPTKAVSEVKVRNNLPAIQMEESTPLTMAHTTVMAPEEVKAKKRGEVKGQTERTREDKLRDRKRAKAGKRRRAVEKEQRQKAVDKARPGLGNKHSKQRALKELEKQASGNIEVIKEKKGKKSMSSKTFFSQLQEEVTTQVRTKSSKSKKDKDKKKQRSSEKFLL